MKGVVYVVHCIDTEGTLHEPLIATFERVRDICGIELEPNRENLRRLQNKEIDLNGLEESVARMVDPHLLRYNDTWDKIDAMLSEILSDGYRRRSLDSFDNGWVYNWYCVDHVGYEANPRRRDMGYHNIFDHYRQMLSETGSERDGLQFHYHPMPFSRQAQHSATHFFAHSDTLFQILARRVIDRHWFPYAFRAGFHTIRPDSHWFLEQFIPFDFSNQAGDPDPHPDPDLEAGRFGDWRRAPNTWQPYHPAHDDYQLLGECRRWVIRCLNVGTRLRLLGQKDVDQAFVEAAEGKPVVMAFTDHDFRDMRADVDGVLSMLAKAATKYPEVKFRFSEARSAVRQALGLEARPGCHMDFQLEGNRLKVSSDKPTFGPQPFLALKTVTGSYYHDNLDFQMPFREWTYVFDQQSIPLRALEAVGVATCDDTGNVTVAVLDPNTGNVTTKYH